MPLKRARSGKFTKPFPYKSAPRFDSARAMATGEERRSTPHHPGIVRNPVYIDDERSEYWPISK